MNELLALMPSVCVAITLRQLTDHASLWEFASSTLRAYSDAAEQVDRPSAIRSSK